jgi:hypothetical protein
MIIDHACGLHEGIHNGRSYKFESAFFKSLLIASEIGEVAGTSLSFLKLITGV